MARIKARVIPTSTLTKSTRIKKLFSPLAAHYPHRALGISVDSIISSDPFQYSQARPKPSPGRRRNIVGTMKDIVISHETLPNSKTPSHLFSNCVFGFKLIYPGNCTMNRSTRLHRRCPVMAISATINDYC